MKRAHFKRAALHVVLLLAAGVLLFGEYFSRSANGSLGSLGRETMAVFRDPGTQWMVFLCAGIYFVTFNLLGGKAEKLKSEKLKREESSFQHVSISVFQRFLQSPDFWLCGLLLIAAMAYAFNYDRASTSTQALVLLAGAAIGKGVRLWANWNAERGVRSAEQESESETWNLKLETLLAILLLLLALAALWHPEGAMQFQYRGLNRWSGPWDNPNIFGMLMGIGVVIGAGLLVSGFRFQVSSSRFQVFSISACQRLLCVAALILCGVGLLKSYSRGAWLGAVVGLALLGFQVIRFQVSGLAGGDSLSRGSRLSRSICWLGRNWRPLSVVLLSVVVLAFWQFRHTEFHPVRRAFSVGNKNDFSWRNRVAAWEGSLAMMADRPVAGFGWNQPERIYDQFYRPPKVAEGMAIQLNHFFTLGMSLGLPALICFGMYVGLSLTRNAKPLTPSLSPSDGERVAEGRVRGCREDCGDGTLDTSLSIPLPDRGGEGGPPSTINHQPAATCRAGAVVLLIGLWFDGGLFNLATAAPLWVLLELGRVGRATPCAPLEEVETLPGAHGVTRPTFAAVSCIPRISRFKFLALASLFAVLLLTGLLWAKARDPFHREWLSVKTSYGGRLSAVAVMPDRSGPFPVVIWCHGSGGSAESSGEMLRQFATLGLAAVGVEYDKTNQANFNAQFAALLDELANKNWARSNSIAWVGNSLGAQRQLSFLTRHPEKQPAALVRLNGGWVEDLDAAILRPTSSRLGDLPVWIAHGENDEVFPVGDARKVAESLRAAGANVKLDTFSGRGHGFGEDQPLLVKRAAEFCAGELGGTTTVPVNVRPGHWYFWLPVGLIGCALVVRRARMRGVVREPAKAARWLTVCTSVAVIVATMVSAAHLALPILRATPTTLKLARQWCVRPELRADFDWLAQRPGASKCRIRDLLEHLNLASLQRGQFVGALPEIEWREFVLSPWIEGTDEDITWRRELWETLQPRVRRETDAEQAATIVARQLCLRTRFIPESHHTKDPRLIWETGVGSRDDFDLIYLAALRSVGIPARRKTDGACEIFNGQTWTPAPRPPLSFLLMPIAVM